MSAQKNDEAYYLARADFYVESDNFEAGKPFDAGTLKARFSELQATWRSLGNADQRSHAWRHALAQFSYAKFLVSIGSAKEGGEVLAGVAGIAESFNLNLSAGVAAAFDDRVLTHAAVAAALGRDPIEGRALGYEFTPLPSGQFVALREEFRPPDSRETATHDGIQLDNLSEDETTGYLLTLGQDGTRMHVNERRAVALALSAPQGASLTSRLRAVYDYEQPSALGRGGYQRKSASEFKAKLHAALGKPQKGTTIEPIAQPSEPKRETEDDSTQKAASEHSTSHASSTDWRVWLVGLIAALGALCLFIRKWAK